MVTAPARKPWRNWGRNQSCQPVAIESPGSEEQLVATVGAARERGQHVKVVGAGHSFTDIACTDGRMLRLDTYNRVLGAGREARTITVQSGITIERLGEELARHGLAQPNLGDVAYQSIAGAISTATHGTGAGFGNIATQVKALTLVLGDGSLLECSAEKDADTFKAAQVGLGALGVISTVTLQCVPAFNIRSLLRPRRLDDVLGELDELVDGNDHFEFFWFPHTEMVQSITNTHTDEPARPRGKASAYINDIVFENYFFGAICRLGSARQRWIPGLSRTGVRLLGGSKVIDRSDRVYANVRLVRFVEMEYAVPRAALAPAVRELRDMIERRGHLVNFPVEVRASAADDITLSTAYGRDSGYIAVHLFRGMEFEPFFHDVEAIMNGHDGRPHWGKMHYQTAATLRPRYPKWDSFIAVRKRLDPEGRFSNAYLERVLGPV